MTIKPNVRFGPEADTPAWWGYKTDAVCIEADMTIKVSSAGLNPSWALINFCQNEKSDREEIMRKLHVTLIIAMALVLAAPCIALAKGKGGPIVGKWQVKQGAAVANVKTTNIKPIKGVNAPGNPPPRGGGGHR